jgi:hypothetical protein
LAIMAGLGADRVALAVVGGGGIGKSAGGQARGGRSRMTRRRIIIVDDHPLFRAALRQTLAAEEAETGVEEAGDLAALEALLAADRDCDLLLLDLNVPGAPIPAVSTPTGSS